MSNLSPATGEDGEPRTPPAPGLLDAAIERGGLHPFFQAKVSVATGRLTGAEALARIGGHVRALSAPAPYVAMAEREQRIDALTFAMARAVATHVAGFNAATSPLPYSINISPLSLERTDFPDRIATAVQSAGLACSQFTLELTDSRIPDYGAKAFETMAALRALGFGLSIDDFGAGHSNIDRLRSYPFTEMKIDPVFIRLAMEEAFAKAALVSCVRLARDLGLRVVAEGVETQEMLDFMRWMQVDDMQGFLLARPMTAADFGELLKRGL